jgi:hypothetical protein
MQAVFGGSLQLKDEGTPGLNRMVRHAHVLAMSTGFQLDSVLVCTAKVERLKKICARSKLEAVQKETGKGIFCAA